MKKERTQINDLTFHLKKPEKEKKSKPKISRRKEIINIVTKINEIKNRNNRENQ